MSAARPAAAAMAALFLSVPSLSAAADPPAVGPDGVYKQ